MRGPSRCATLLAMALLLPVAAAAQTNVYRWVDKDGKVHYSDAPPTEKAEAVTSKRMGGGLGSDALPLPYATQVAMQRFPVKIYTSADCGDPCDKGRELLSKRGVPYGEARVVPNSEAAETVKKLIGGLYVPVLTVGSNAVRGFSDGRWNAALDEAGYPKALLPGQGRPRPPALPSPEASAAQPSAAGSAPPQANAEPPPAPTEPAR